MLLKMLFSSCVLYCLGFEVITLNNENHIALTTDVNKNSVDKVIREINEIKEKVIHMYIDSPGGEVFEGDKLVSNMAYHQSLGKEFICIAENAHSMAFYIFQYCDYRYITQSAKMMQHQISIASNGPLVNNDNYIKMVKDISIKINTLCASRIKMSLNDFIGKINTDWWVYGQDIIDNNVADKIVLVGCSVELVDCPLYGKTESKLVGLVHSILPRSLILKNYINL